jgi:NADP-dependent 3-hydroxy acid dehydrogenase YdfG
MKNLKNKVVIITGASSGIGKANALYLAENGAKVVLGDVREDRLQTVVDEIISVDGKVSSQVTDVRRRYQVESLVTKGMDSFGRIDVIINCAGLMPQSYLCENNYEEWERGIDTNIKGVLYGIGAVLPIMHKQETGHIINISSIGAHNVIPGGAVYSATKYAVKAITEGLRKEEAENNKNIRVTSISPGSIDTEFTHSIADPEIRAKFDELSENAIEPESVARLIAYAINEEEHVALNEVIIRPTEQIL